MKTLTLFGTELRSVGGAGSGGGEWWLQQA